MYFQAVLHVKQNIGNRLFKQANPSNKLSFLTKKIDTSYTKAVYHKYWPNKLKLQSIQQNKALANTPQKPKNNKPKKQGTCKNRKWKALRRGVASF